MIVMCNVIDNLIASIWENIIIRDLAVYVSMFEVAMIFKEKFIFHAIQPMHLFYHYGDNTIISDTLCDQICEYLCDKYPVLSSMRAWIIIDVKKC